MKLAVIALLAASLSGAEPKDRRRTLFFFGGGFNNGSPQQFYSKAEYLASRGMVAASAEYRITSKDKTLPDASIEDWGEEAAELGLDGKR